MEKLNSMNELYYSPKFIIVGKNGGGKSTLINSIFGKVVAEVGDIPDVTKKIEHYILPNSGVEIYDTPGFDGVDEEAQRELENFLHLDKDPDDVEEMPGDVIVFLFSKERVSATQFKDFERMKLRVKDKLIVAKNVDENEDPNTSVENATAIENRIGINPILINAKSGENINELISVIIGLLPPEKVISFNESLEVHKRQAREIAKISTIKIASKVAILRSRQKEDIIEMIETHKDDLNKLILEAYLKELPKSQLIDYLSNEQSYVAGEKDGLLRFASGSFTSVIGGLIGILGGPIGVAIGSGIGFLFGTAIIPRISRGGFPAVVNIISQGYGICEIIEDAMDEPHLFLTQSTEPLEIWVEKNKNRINRKLQQAIVKTEYLLKSNALADYLNNPNTDDPTLVEIKLKNVIEEVFNE